MVAKPAFRTTTKSVDDVWRIPFETGGEHPAPFPLSLARRAVDTTGVEPLAHPFATVRDIALRLRDDIVTETNQRENNQRSAPSVENGLFLVPKVIE